MKKYLALILALAMSCSLLTACGGGEEPAPAEDTAEETALVYAVEAGSAGEATAAENGFEYNSVASQADALMEVASGNADACIIDLTMAKAMTGEGTSYEDLAIAAEMDREEYGIGFRKGSDLTAKVNELMKKYMEDGTLDALAEKYELTLVK